MLKNLNSNILGLEDNIIQIFVLKLICSFTAYVNQKSRKLCNGNWQV